MPLALALTPSCNVHALKYQDISVTIWASIVTCYFGENFQEKNVTNICVPIIIHVVHDRYVLCGMSYLHNLRQGDIIESVIVQLETAKPFFQLCTYLHIT